MTGRREHGDAGHDLPFVLDQAQPILHDLQIFANAHGPSRGATSQRQVRGPERPLLPPDEVVRVGKGQVPRPIEHAADVVGMGVRDHHDVHLARVNAGSLQVARELTRGIKERAAPMSASTQ